MAKRLAALAVVALLVGVGVTWTQVIQGGSKRLAWIDVTAQMSGVLWPKSVTRSFWKRRQVVRYVARTFPNGPPKVPPFDFAHRRLILVAAGPRSSTGYGVEIVRITERRSTIDVLARETTPSLGDHTVPRLTSPYLLVTIPATSKRVYVQWQGRP
ncbi:MAG: protease complex subunit PrcB family protein [Verrucomicrobiota bacterium]